MVLDQVASHQGTEATGGAGDQDRLVGIDRAGNRQDDLADVLALPQVAEGLWGTAHVPARDRRVLERALLKEGEDLAEHLGHAIGTGFDQIEGAVGDVGVIGRELCLGIADIGLAHLQEATAVRQEIERGIDELSGQGVEDDV